MGRQSPRAYLINNKTRIYDPQDKTLKALKVEAIKQLPIAHVPWEKTINVNVLMNCYFAIPKSWTSKNKQLAITGEIKYIKKPDCDNVSKLYLDSIKGIVFEDDAQVSILVIKKTYDINPRVEIICRQN